ncbi:MAG: histidine kinase [Acidobacteriia bacterium]|nr:histidine kinase [Terriglobia bacterium]
MVRKLLELAPLVVFAFGALTFSILTVFYWGERRRKPGGPTAFPAFTLVCAAAFLNNLLFQVISLGGAGESLTAGVILVRNLTAGLLPALMLHLVFEIERSGLPGRRPWRAALIAFYGGAAVSTLARGLNEAGLVSTPGSDALYHAPAVTLAVAGGAGLLLQALSRRPCPVSERAHRRWVRALLVLMLLSAAANLGGVGILLGQMPDYLLLAFFCVSLYYRERLVFFDLLVKRGAFLGVGLVILTLWVAVDGRFLFGPSSDWSPGIYAVGLLLFWLAAPWVYAQVARVVDRVWLRRPYSAAEAERQFIRGVQPGATEDELRARAASSLSDIFQAPAEVRFDRSALPHPSGSEDTGLTADLERNGARLGTILLTARPNGVPFLSDDRRLLQSLAGTLSLVLENVRFRVERHRQEEREQQLRWLASRAELKALRAQINPHFLFNALSVIAGLLHYQPELADETIERLAQVFRYTLRKSENEWAPLAEEVEFVSAYLGIEQARFGERLQVKLEVDPAAARILIPAMSIQPLVENAIRHGVSAMEGRGTVELRATLDRACLSVEVRDNGPGFPPGFCLEEAGDGHGLRNVAERLRGYYGDAARLSWESGRSGTRVVLTLPQSAVSGFTGGDARDTGSDC